MVLLAVQAGEEEVTVEEEEVATITATMALTRGPLTDLETDHPTQNTPKVKRTIMVLVGPEVAVVTIIAAMALRRDPETHHQTQDTVRVKMVIMADMVHEDQEVLVDMAEEEEDTEADGAITDAEDPLLLQALEDLEDLEDLI